jgi:chromosome partitioning protein
MIIGIVSLKGGAGKSTTAINLAVAYANKGYKVTIIDTDANGTCIHWSGLRPENLPNIMCVALQTTDALRKNIKGLYDGCDIIIIDGTPAIDEKTSTIILLSSLFIVPVLPSPPDVWATKIFIEKYEQVKTLKEDLKGYFLVNRIDERKMLAKQIDEVLKDFNLPIFKTRLHDYTAYENSLLEGLGVLENSNPKAKNDIIQLTKEIDKLLNI